MTARRPRLLVMTSTFPRWENDNEPSFVFELSRRLATQFDVVVLAPHAPGAQRRERIAGIEVVRFCYAPLALQRLAYRGGILANLRQHKWTWLLVPAFLVAMTWSAATLLRRRDIHVVHAHWLFPQAWVALNARRLARRRATPILATAHGGDLFALRSRLGTYLKRQVLKQAEHVTVVSNAMADRAEILGAERAAMTVAPMGVDARHEFAPASKESRDAATILYVGRLVEKKGVDVLLHALVDVLNAVPHAKARVIGDGPERPSLERLARSLGILSRIEFTGAIPHHALPEYFRSATLFAMPSVEARDGDQEGFGLVLIEAMACGCPVIASDLPAVRDIVRRETGILIEPGNTTALARALIELLGDSERRRTLALHARDDVLEHRDWSTAADRYAALLKNLAAGHA